MLHNTSRENTHLTLPLGIPVLCCSFSKLWKEASRAWDIFWLVPGVRGGIPALFGISAIKRKNTIVKTFRRTNFCLGYLFVEQYFVVLNDCWEKRKIHRTINVGVDIYNLKPLLWNLWVNLHSKGWESSEKKTSKPFQELGSYLTKGEGPFKPIYLTRWDCFHYHKLLQATRKDTTSKGLTSSSLATNLWESFTFIVVAGHYTKPVEQNLEINSAPLREVLRLRAYSFTNFFTPQTSKVFIHLKTNTYRTCGDHLKCYAHNDSLKYSHSHFRQLTN